MEVPFHAGHGDEKREHVAIGQVIYRGDSWVRVVGGRKILKSQGI